MVTDPEVWTAGPGLRRQLPGTADSRAGTPARIRDALGDEKTDQLVVRGASMPHDELIAYAIEHLGATGAR